MLGHKTVNDRQMGHYLACRVLHFAETEFETLGEKIVEGKRFGIDGIEFVLPVLC